MNQFFLKKHILLFLVFSLALLPGWSQIVAWDFTGQNSGPATVAATVYNANLVSTSGVSNVTRGATAAGGVTVNNSFRTTGFKNDGIYLTNTDYFQVTLTAASGYVLSLSTIDAKFNGTASYYAGLGVASEFAYSLDGSNFTFIGDSIHLTSLTMPQISTSSITALQNVPAGTTVTLRYYASGQTSTGGWGFYSSASGVYGLALGGSVTAVSSATNYFRSAQSGNWASTSSWQSSSDNSNWIAATLAPDSNSAGITIQSGHTITAAAGTTISTGTATINGTLVMAPRSSITIASGKTLTSNGAFRLQSDATGTASISNSTGASLGGFAFVTVQQYLTAQRAYRLMGHPFNANVALNILQPYVDITGSGSGLTSGSASAYNYLTGVWTAYTANNQTWNKNQALFLFVRGTPGQGIGVTDGSYTPSAPTISITGQINMGNLNYTVNAAGSFSNGSALGWNAIGNPYPAPIDVNSIGGITSPGGSGASVYIWNATKGSVGSGTASGGYDFYTLGNPIIIPVYGAFFIKNTSGINQPITFSESNKSTGTPLNLLGAGTATQQGFLLTIADSLTYWDKLKISFDNKSNIASTDQQDLEKFSNINLDFYSLGSDNNRLAINSRPVLQSTTDLIPLGIKTSQQRTFTMKASEVNLATGSNLYLHDKYTNSWMQIINGMSYNFSVTADTATQGNNRFEVAMKTSAPPVVITLTTPVQLMVEATKPVDDPVCLS